MTVDAGVMQNVLHSARIVLACDMLLHCLS